MNVDTIGMISKEGHVRKRGGELHRKERGFPTNLAKSLEIPENVENERLMELFMFVTQPSAIRPPQIDTVSASRLSQGGFTLGEANYVFDELNRLEGTVVMEEYRTYRAMQRAIQIVLAHRSNGEKGRISF